MISFLDIFLWFGEPKKSSEVYCEPAKLLGAKKVVLSRKDFGADIDPFSAWFVVGRNFSGG
jgi:hypothetical protein